ncbi:MarR family winged helix-turn-helix transcriptional regulator [Luteipulveratus mongoliensis]|uniref:HTH marR-type domain-containing protein n=1 Tax=Luteipulveratus mongoliensis TaxID=571913 RepID=A0A0K1JH31_9MICO|nr:MarR family transcriptional regulator [Luteipulveratus mongoliensis]AKU16019.1 hypothetical protein VV02_09390 [Luteipulveratus mongoliensis]
MVDTTPHPDGLLRFPTYVLGLLHKASHAEAGSSLRDHWVLVCLDEERDLSQQQLSDALRIDRSDVVRLIDGLESAGYVVRQRDSHDRRRYQLSITPAGRAQRKRVDRQIEQAQDRVLAALDPAEREQLHRLALKALGHPES